MSGDRSLRRVHFPRIDTILIVVATLAAAGMLGISYFFKSTHYRALRQDDPINRVQAVEELVKLGRDGVPELLSAIQDSNRKTRLSALVGLGRIGLQASDAVDAVRGALADNDPAIRSVAVGTFRRINPDVHASMRILISMLADPNEGVRESVEKALNETGSKGIQPILDAIRNEADEVRVRVWPILRKMSNAGSSPDIVKAARDMLDHSNPAIRAEALFSIISWGKGSNAEIRELLRIEDRGFVPNPTSDWSSTSVDVALQAISRMGPDAVQLLPDVIDILERHEPAEVLRSTALSQPDELKEVFEIHPRLRSILAVLSSMQTDARPAVPALVRRLHELHTVNRIPIASTLVDIGCDAEVLIPVLVPLLSVSREFDDTQAGRPRHFEEVPHRAAVVLQRASPEEARKQVARLIPELGQVETNINRTTLFALSGFSQAAPEAVALAMSPLVSHPDGSIQATAINTLWNMGSAAAPAVPSLVAQLEECTQRQHLEVSHSIIYLFGTIGPSAKEAVPSLLKLIDEPVHNIELSGSPEKVSDVFANRNWLVWLESVQLRSIAVIGKIREPSPEVLAVLRKQLNSESPARRMAATKSLGLVFGPSELILADMIRLLHDVDDPVRIQAALVISKLQGDRKDCVPRLKEFLTDANSHVRRAAVLALGSIGPDAKSAVPLLEEIQYETADVDPLWYLRLKGANAISPWYDDTPDFEQQTVAQAVKDAIAAIEQDDHRNALGASE